MKTDIVANRYKSDGSMGREGLSESKDCAKRVGSRLKDREGGQRIMSLHTSRYPNFHHLPLLSRTSFSSEDE